MIGLLAAVCGALLVWLLLAFSCWRLDLAEWRSSRSRARAEHELRLRVEEHMWRSGLYTAVSVEQSE